MSEFDKLSRSAQNYYREFGRQLTNLAQGCAVPIIVAPPVSAGGDPNGATGVLLKLGEDSFVVTAEHVLRRYEERTLAGEILNWQVGKLPPFDPTLQISWRSKDRDVVFLKLTASQSGAVGAGISWMLTDSAGWPPRPPKIGEIVIVAGYPRILREVGAPRIGSGSYSAMFRVTQTGDGYFYCQIEREELVAFGGSEIPPAGVDLGGVSGGPALLMEQFFYPLVGVITEHSTGFALMRIATLEGIEIGDLR